MDLQITAFLSIVIDQLGTIFNSQVFIDNLKATAEIHYMNVPNSSDMKLRQTFEKLTHLKEPYIF